MNAKSSEANAKHSEVLQDLVKAQSQKKKDRASESRARLKIVAEKCMPQKNKRDLNNLFVDVANDDDEEANSEN